MKKILLGTTGLVGAALLATAAHAETPKVTLGGFSNFQAGYVDSDIDAGSEKFGFRNDNEISLRVDGKMDSGLGYGAVIDLEADINGDTDNGAGTQAARTYTYLDGTWGRVEMGSNKGSAATMRVDASTLAVATGGINGDWRFFVADNGSTTIGGATRNFITNSKLPGEHGALTAVGGEGTYNATKITYYSPRFSGFQAGVSYTPDQTSSRGQTADRGTNDQLDVWDVALGYENQFADGWKLAAAATGEWSDSNTAGTQDISAWNIGALVGWQGFSLAGSYGDWNDSNNTSGADGDYWTVGLGYEAGAVGLSATYFESEQKQTTTNEFDNIVLGADYKLAPGLTPYAEVSFYDFQDGSGATEDNQGTAILLGTQVAF